MTPFKWWCVLLSFCCLSHPVFLASINDARAKNELDFEIDIKAPLIKQIEQMERALRYATGDFLTPTIVGILLTIQTTVQILFYGLTGMSPTVIQALHNQFSVGSTLTVPFFNALALYVNQALGFKHGLLKSGGLRGLTKKKRHQNRRLG